MAAGAKGEDKTRGQVFPPRPGSHLEAPPPPFVCRHPPCSKGLTRQPWAAHTPQAQPSSGLPSSWERLGAPGTPR